MGKCRGNKQDDEIFLAILPNWNDILDDASNDDTDGSLLVAALNRVCLVHNWTMENFQEYQMTLRR
jgi:hypothetical protein